MKHIFGVIGMIGIAACTRLPATPPTRAPAVAVMVPGTYHKGHPGAELANAQADNVLTGSRQEDLAALADPLAAFKPMAIRVESRSPRAGFRDLGYPQFTPDQLASDPDETSQIACQPAIWPGISRVDGIDAQQGEIDFFPFERINSLAEKKSASWLAGRPDGTAQRNRIGI